MKEKDRKKKGNRTQGYNVERHYVRSDFLPSIDPSPLMQFVT